MTDITDKDKREARKWAEQTIANRVNSPTDPWVIAARLFLAAVEPPAPTLAEELWDTARWWRDGAPTWEQCCGRFDALAARAEQIEKDLDEARAEVERLTAKNEELIRTDNYREFREFLGVATVPQEENVAPDQQSNSLKTPNSSFKSSLKEHAQNPADVPSGEPWIVEVDGERRTAVRAAQYHRPWSTFKESGSVTFAKDHEITLVSRFVPAPRVITDPDELDKLPAGTIIRTADNGARQRLFDGRWYYPKTPDCSDDRPVTVLWEPGA